MPSYIAVTGCAGFIGRVVTRQLLARGDKVFGIDALTYAADPLAIQEFQRDTNFCFVGRDIRDREFTHLPDVDYIVHLAAETHVDRSIDGPSRFTSVNVVGTHHLLELARKVSTLRRFIYISTDEIYGPITAPWKATHEWGMKPSSPYAASKAAADLMVQAYGTTFALPHSIVRMTNAYGPFQYPEKLVPKCVRSLQLGRSIPIHGDGSQVRCWLSVDDAASAILHIVDHAEELPAIVNVGGNTEASVKQVATLVTRAFYEGDESEWVHRLEFGHHRPGQDMRYAVDDSPLREAGWRPVGDFCRDLPGIVEQERRSFRF